MLFLPEYWARAAAGVYQNAYCAPIHRDWQLQEKLEESADTVFALKELTPNGGNGVKDKHRRKQFKREKNQIAMTSSAQLWLSAHDGMFKYSQELNLSGRTGNRMEGHILGTWSP